MEVREGGREKYLLDLPAPGAGTDSVPHGVGDLSM